MHWSVQNLSRLSIKAPTEQPTSRSTLSSVHTTRSPLLQIDSRRNSVSSQTPFSTAESRQSISSDISSSAMKDNGRQTGNRGLENRIHNNNDSNQNHAPNHTASQPQGSSQPTTGSGVPEPPMYLYNSLHSFSFGPQTPTNMPAPRPVDPLSPLQHESDSYSDEFPGSASNDTPRPSVVAQHHRDNSHHLISSHPAQETPAQLYRQASPTPMSPGGRRRVVKDRDRENESASPSASNTSLSSRSGPVSRTDSRTSNRTNTTNLTSPHDYSSTDDDDFSRNSPSVTDDAGSSTLADQSMIELTSEDEYGGSEFEDEVYSDEDIAIEIGSAHFEGGGSSLSHEWDQALYSGANIGSGHLVASSSGRRGVNIPGDPHDLSSGRLREDSLATLRRPSRSLDDEFQGLRLPRSDNIHGNLGLDDPLSRPGLPSPASVPQSDSDWQRLEGRGGGSYKGKEVDRSRLPSVQLEGRPFNLHGPPNQSVSQQDFDADWSNLRGGITFLDSNEMTDIVAPMDRGERKASWSGTRFLNFFNRRPSAATVSTIHGDSFGRAIKKWDGRGNDWTVRKEKAESGGAITVPMSSDPLSPRPSVMVDRAESVTSESTVKPERNTGNYKGMSLGSVELWRNERVGRFKVDRKETKPSDSNKGPQQRLVVTAISDPYIQNTEGQKGPPVTVHKHSKATAFSISRHYRWEKQENTDPNTNLSVPNAQKPRVLVSTHNKKGSSMILLAPRRVQEAFTNTNTTRRLESHGLLDDREQERRRQKARERDTRRDRRREEGNRNRAPERARDDSGVGTDSMSSSFSGATLIPPPASAPAPAPHPHTYPPNHPSPSSEASASRESGLDRTSSNSSLGPSRRRRRVRVNDPLEYDELDENEDDAPSRTPYPEVYGTVDSTYFEQQTRADNESQESFLSRIGLRRTQPTYVPGATANQPDVVYKPPWMTMASRNKQEQQQRVVENLNTSFKDVGLLPSTQRDKFKQSTSASRKSKKITGKAGEKLDIFKDVPPDVLYMLLPLWPGETDGRSREEFPFEKPYIASKDRQYLMIYYKTFESSGDEDSKKSESESKKRSRGSQNSSHDSTHSQKDKSHILLSSFHITCRVVSYAALQGSGVRVPDDGLAVTGPLQEAYEKAKRVTGPENEGEWAMGACHSRDAGIEFYSETFRRMNLCIPVGEEPIPARVVSEEDEYPEGDLELTPLGRAVMEMAWVGGMALTSFG